MRRFFLLLAGLGLGAASTAAAQDRGTLDVGLFGRYTLLDASLDLDNAVGIGGRLGYFVMRNIALETQYSLTNTKPQTGTAGNVQHKPIYVRLNWNYVLGAKTQGIVGAGWVRDQLDPKNSPNLTDDGYSFLLGMQRRLGDGGHALRLDLVTDFLTSPVNQTPANRFHNTNFALQAGLNLRVGHQGPRDGDKDGVADAMDACLNTPMGEMVDARGCTMPKDADMDGVIDANDRCANTPAGTRVDASGCAVPVDSDRDGVMDNVDACANTPAGTRVDARGCPVPVDSDRDGVMDNVDRCPNTAAGTRVDANGCAIPVDSDSDGVMDNADACPNTAAGVRVDARGCAVVFEEGRRNIVLEGVNFATGSAVLTADARAVLDRMAVALVNAPDVNVEVAGYTDNTGSRTLNVRLSGQRAESVRAYLESKGVAASRMTAKGYGPDDPMASNDTAEGRLQNRRVELKRTN